MTRNRQPPRVPHPRPDPASTRLAQLLASGDLEVLEREARKLLSRLPAHAYALKALAVALLRRQSYAEALPVVRRALRVQPNDAELHANLGVCLFELGSNEEAIPCFRQATVLAPENPAVQANLAEALNRLGRTDEGIEAAERAVQLNPADVATRANLGAALLTRGDTALALPHLLAAAEMSEDDNLEVLRNLALALKRLGHFGAAIDIYGQLADHYSDGQTLSLLIECCLLASSWGSLERRLAELRQLVEGPEAHGAAPFACLAFPGLDGRHHRLIAGRHAAIYLANSGATPLEQARQRKREAGRRLRLGYLSSDFHAHATSQLLVGVIEQHDRSAFEVIGYSLGPDDGSDLQQRIRGAFDRFRDLRALSSAAGAMAIAADEVDILVDLKGWTKDHRLDILAYRPAPVQVSWLGYPGTLGSECLADFIIGDPVVIPSGAEADYTEKIVRLANCYQPNDDRRVIPVKPSRDAAGLPQGAFVFCCFNQLFKVNPGVLDLWCRILASVEEGILWLLSPRSDEGRANFLREAEQRGLSRERIVFAPELPLDEHIGRLQLADLALDTFPYNSHTTGSDALWAGVPMVTVLGETFAGRVGASLLHAAGLAEFVATDADGYVEIARRYAGDPVLQATTRARLAVARSSSPLFDTTAFTRDLERLYLEMWAKQRCA